VWQVSIRTNADGEEAAVSLLEQTFQQPPSVYCDEATGARTVSVYLKRKPGKIAGAGKFSIKRLPPQDWAESWKRHFKPIDVDGVLLIKPGWSRRRPRQGQKVIVLDPGLSFGTGHHPTTLFCLRTLAKCRHPGQKQTFLDIGTGSGILAIAAAKLGYSVIEAFDFDPAAIRVSRENAARNRVAHRVRPLCKDLTKLSGKSARKYDVVCANLAHDLLISEASKIVARLNPGGRLIAAGILRRQFGEVRKNFQRFHLTLQAKTADKTWQSGQFVL
jgi:ribosomal protein L11 methyltransferase